MPLIGQQRVSEYQGEVCPLDWVMAPVIDAISSKKQIYISRLVGYSCYYPYCYRSCNTTYTA